MQAFFMLKWYQSKIDKMNNKKLINLLFEFGQLYRIKHEGWRLIGIENPKSVADHGLRAAQIGYFLARMEKYQDPYQIVTMLVFHDMGECRIGDIHKVANRYVQANEEKAVEEQLSPLKKEGEELMELWKETETQNTKAGAIAKDADLLEHAITAKEYLEKGYKYAENWIKNVEKKLKTKSAKILLQTLKKADSNEWWQGLKKI